MTLYATNAIGCEFGWPEGMQRGLLFAISVGFLGISALAGWLVFAHWRAKARLQSAPAPALSILGIYGLGSAFVAMIGLAIPTLTTSLCV